MQFIEEKVDEALKNIEDISATAVERKKNTVLRKLAIGVAYSFVF